MLVAEGRTVFKNGDLKLHGCRQWGWGGGGGKKWHQSRYD